MRNERNKTLTQTSSPRCSRSTHTSTPTSRSKLLSWSKLWVRPKVKLAERDRETLFWNEGRPVTDEEYQEFME